MLKSRAAAGVPREITLFDERLVGPPFGTSLVRWGGLGVPLAVAIGGAVAQLGERRVRNAKVEGSIPFRSTSFLI